MRYLSGQIFSSGGGNKNFEDNFEKIFGKKDQDPQKDLFECMLCLDKKTIPVSEGVELVNAPCPACVLGVESKVSP